MTKQGMSTAIIPNKNHWYVSIAFQRNAARALDGPVPRRSGLVTAMPVMILFWCASDLVSGANRMTVRTAVV